jgi:FKBP-type peptidyl-prolyl cis-trans isomerase (trigger factor)
VIIDFKGSIDGVLFDGGSSENFPLSLVKARCWLTSKLV